MNCPDIETIERFVANELQPEERAEFEAHLQDCDQCPAALVEAK
ncbi:MAG: zf-HC2 domain-containing protein, partial [Planctomycetes bacterium]|nr:zf-HC2 domain-containing protein [Planctomycetota bacterium]